MTSDSKASALIDRPRLPQLWLAALLPPAAWIADLEVSLLLSRHVDATQRKLPLMLVALACLALAASAGAWSRRQGRHDKLSAAERALTTWAGGLAVFFMLLIAAQAVPVFVFAPRDLP
jgi:hypothetical protein